MTAEPSEEAPPAPDLQRAPVLLVDDNAGKRVALKAILAPLGCSVIEADSGRAALRCLMAQDFAVILLDVSMPVMDGFETAAFIRQRRQSEMTPIIFITAYASDEILPTARYVQGAVDFIFAPVQPDELRAKVSFFASQFTRAAALAGEARHVQTTADQLRLLTESAPVGIFQTDVDNRYVYTNPRWTQITGVSANEAVGRDWASIIGVEERDDLMTQLADGVVSAAELSHRFELRPADGPCRVVLVTSRSVPCADGGNAGWVGTLADVTAEAGAEAAMAEARDKATEASQQKSDFLANMTHEIRTPMIGVIGMTELLLDTDLDATQRDFAQTVQTSGEALMTIIDDILDFATMDTGDLRMVTDTFSLRALVDELISELAGPASGGGLQLTAEVAPNVPKWVSGDQARLRQILENIVGNATKFTPTGKVVVTVTEAERSGADTILRFDVADTGVGIAPDKLATIFSPFTQADTSTSRRYGGTGLGLAISGKLVTLMGGEYGVHSELGVGSTFWFTVKMKVVPAVEADA